MKTRMVALHRMEGGVMTLAPPSSHSREPSLQIADVPIDVPNSLVIRQANRVAFVPWPRSVAWEVIAEAQQGRIFRPQDCAALAEAGTLTP